MKLDDQILLAKNSLHASQERLKDRIKWVEEARTDVEIWESLVASLENLQRYGLAPKEDM